MLWHEATTRIDGIAFDRDGGIGSTPDCGEIDHFGATVLMRPSVFLRLAAPKEGGRPGSAAFLAGAIASGRPLAPAFLKVDGEDGEPSEVFGHEGRHRMSAIRDALGDVPVPVHVLRPGRRARHMDDAWLAAASSRLLCETKAEMVEGPLFLAARVSGRTVTLHDGTAPVTGTPYTALSAPRLAIDALCALQALHPGLTMAGVADAFHRSADAVLDALEALGRDGTWERTVRIELGAATRGRPPAERVADALGAARIARHAEAMEAAATAPSP